MQQKQNTELPPNHPSTLIITPPSPSQQPTIQKLNKIRESSKKPSLNKLLKQLAFKTMLTNIIEKDYPNIQTYLQSLISQKTKVDLLITGDYMISVENEKSSTYKFLIISDACICYLWRKKEEQGSGGYRGFRYRIGSSVYLGEFRILDKNIVQHTSENSTQEKPQKLYQISCSQTGSTYTKYLGKWRKGELIWGTKQTYDYKEDGLMLVITQKIKQSYTGSFHNMKYEGQGVLTKYNLPLEKDNKKEIKAIFKNGEIQTILPKDHHI